jgi:hypothetical protein
VTEQNTPSRDSADENSLAGILRTMRSKFAQNLDVMIPAKVIAYDRTLNVAKVQPMVSLLTTGGEVVTRAAIAEVPVVALGGGGFVINFPLKEGDLGWLEASDRDISLFMQSLKDHAPNTRRMHTFEDARFLPDAIRGFDTQGLPSGAMTIQALNGSTRVTLTQNAIHIKSAGEVKVEGASLKFLGPAEFDSLVEMPAGAKINGRTFITHTHGGVQSGGGTSGGVT